MDNFCFKIYAIIRAARFASASNNNNNNNNNIISTTNASALFIHL